MPTAERALLHQGGRPGTWGSLGLWRDDADDYAQACESLARAVADAAGLRRGDRVLSLCCGDGDELCLWATAYGAAEVWGIEHDPRRVRAASARVATTPLPAGCSIQVLQGDARRLQGLALPLNHFDRVLCVDAAYHLNPRLRWLQAVRPLLRPGGRLAYTDLSRGPAQRPGWAAALRAAAWLTGVPLADVWPLADQAARLRQAGLAGVQAQALDAAVLDGFARHVRRQGARLALTAWHPGWRRPALTARLIGPCRAAGLGYALLSAGRPRSAVATASAERTALSSSGTPASA